MINLTPQPVWINGKLVYPEGWISPEVREAMRRAQEDSLDYARHLANGANAAPTEPVKVDPWTHKAFGEIR